MKQMLFTNGTETKTLQQFYDEICPACGDGKPPIIDVKLGTTAETCPNRINFNEELK